MNKGNKQFHPAANIFPMMSKPQLASLAEDIRTNGQHDPIVYYKGQVLDGRNRIRACEIAGVEPDTCEIDEDSSFNPVAFVVGVNLHRRHLNESQRATVAAKLKNLLEPEAKERQRDGGKKAGRGRPKKVPANLPEPNGKSFDTRDQAAKLLNVSGRSVDHAAAVLELGSKELVQAVERGEVAVSRAASVAKTIDKPKQLATATAKAAVKEKTPFDHLKHWWGKASDTQRCLFRDWLEKDAK